MTSSYHTKQPKTEQSQSRTGTGTLLSRLDKETQAAVLEQRYIKCPLKKGTTPHELLIQSTLQERAMFDMELNNFVAKVPYVPGASYKVGEPIGAILNSGHRVIGLKGYYVLASHLSCLWFLGILPRSDWDEEMDHYPDRNVQNNHPGNLRLATRAINCRNKGISKYSTSGHTGVSYRKESGRYRSYIKVNQKFIHLGFFLTLEEAITAREDFIAANPELGFSLRDLDDL